MGTLDRIFSLSQGTHLHVLTWVERGTVRVKCLAQEHNATSLGPRARTQTSWSRDRCTNHEASCLFKLRCFSVEAVLPVATRLVFRVVKLLVTEKEAHWGVTVWQLIYKIINPCILNIIVGKLSHWLQVALGNSAKDVDYLLIDRASNRYKVCGVTSLCVVLLYHVG